MKRVALVAAHFTPSNLTSVHRARLWAQHLPELGWEPVIVTTHYRHYEEALDWDLHGLVRPDLRVVRTPAFPTRPLRIIGDVGVRALPFHFAALARLAQQHAIDFAHITIPSNYSAVLGRMLHASFGIPYGIDYIDPWVIEWAGSERRFSKAWCAARLAQLLEPWSVREASLITGVAPLYYEDVIARNPHLAGRVVTAAMPYGGADLDFQHVRNRERPPYLFDPNDGAFHIVYAGAMLPRGFDVLERMLAGIQRMGRDRPDLARKLRIHFIGTGRSPSDPHGHNVLPYVRRAGLEEQIDEHPQRIPYTDVLSHLLASSAILIVGSTEAHYTPSKAFQAVLARKPVLALLHRASTAADFLERARAARVVKLDSDALPSEEEISAAFIALMEQDAHAPDAVRWDVLEDYTARASARALADALDLALARNAR